MLTYLKKLVNTFTLCKNVDNINTRISIKFSCCSNIRKVRDYKIKRPLTEEELYKIDCFIKDNITEDSDSDIY